MIEAQALLEEISASSPTGDDLEYDAAFAAAERAALGKPEQQMGATVIAAEEPDWAAVEKQAVALFARTKDLRVATLLAKALLHRNGWRGLCTALELIRGLCERYWETVHPRLDPDDDNDPTLRINTLSGLADGSMLLALRAAPLLSSRTFGSIGLREVQAASGQAEPAEGVSFDPAAVHAAFQEASPEDIEAVRQAVEASREHLSAIDAVFSEKTAAQSPDLSRLVALVAEARKTIVGHTPGAAVEAGQAPAGAEAPSSGPAHPRSAPGEISSRQNVAHALDRICAYYARYEPTSPIPLLLQRCKRLLTKDFLEILRDMAPDALSQVELIAGKPEE